MNEGGSGGERSHDRGGHWPVYIQYAVNKTTINPALGDSVM